MCGLLRGLGAGVLFLVLALGCDSVTPVAPADAVLTLTVNPSRITSDGQATITVLARKTDGFPVNEGTEITFATTLGRLDPEVAFTDEQGRATTILHGNGEVGIATITAVSGSVQVGGGEAGIEVRIGSIPNALEFFVNPNSVNFRDIDRDRTFRLVATVVDDLGDPLAGATARFNAEIGKLESRGNPVPTNVNGRARDTLTVKREELIRHGNSVGESFVVGVIVTGGDTEGLEEIPGEDEVFIFGFPLDILLETSQSSIPVEGGIIQLIATVRDDEGRVLEDAGVQFGSSAGRVASFGAVVPTDVNGQAFDFLEVTEDDLAATGVNTVMVTATVQGAGGVDIVDAETINVQGLPPIAGFTFERTCADVAFTNTTTPASTPTDPVEFQWSYGDGVIEIGPVNPVHTYSAAGSFVAELMATNAFGDSTFAATVVLPEVPAAPSFTASPNPATVGQTITLTGTAAAGTDGPLTFEWDLDFNGATFTVDASGQSVTTSYGSAGNRTIALRVTGCSGELGEATSPVATQTVTVQ